jgi:demethylmenaquinone methyltransferase/2-methoxy-6-polyprenyl-1,4-benzoquinol methylase
MGKRSLSNTRKDDDVRKMFSSIAHSYDFLNRILSLRIDRHWRKKAVQQLGNLKNGFVLDVATGTADLALEVVKSCRGVQTVVGVDFSEEMLRLAQKKIEKYGLKEKIDLNLTNAQALPFCDGVFDAVLIAFGIRNFSDRLKGLSEMKRVLKKGGRVVILEFSRPKSCFVRAAYYLYFLKILPVIGSFFSKVRYAYQYLPESVLDFPENEGFVNLMKKAGLEDIRYDILTYGVVCLYVGRRV